MRSRRPDKVALVCGEQRYTYARLDQMANRLAQALRTDGVRRGDRVAIYLSNSVEAVVAIFAVLKAAGVFVIVSRTTKPDKLLYILNNCQATAVVADTRALAQGLGERLLGEVASLRSLVICGAGAPRLGNGDPRCRGFDSIQAAGSDAPLQPENIDLDLACLIYTSGTTGEPKGVMCDHSNVVFVTNAIVEYLKTHRARCYPERFADGLQLRPLSVAGDLLCRRHAGAGGIVRVPGS